MIPLNVIKGRLSNIHVQGDLPNIFVFATPRSGSTFLLEFLHAQPEMKTYNEPLSVRKAAMRRVLEGATDDPLSVIETWKK